MEFQLKMYEKQISENIIVVTRFNGVAGSGCEVTKRNQVSRRANVFIGRKIPG
jgi:hypothetical protein